MSCVYLFFSDFFLLPFNFQWYVFFFSSSLILFVHICTLYSFYLPFFLFFFCGGGTFRKIFISFPIYLTIINFAGKFFATHLIISLLQLHLFPLDRFSVSKQKPIEDFNEIGGGEGRGGREEYREYYNRFPYTDFFMTLLFNTLYVCDTIDTCPCAQHCVWVTTCPTMSEVLSRGFSFLRTVKI